ncbi:MAG: DUF1330 domain-containing protein [Phreatobacter sp.]|uniref:DUF1330 domain-containing protein n=1 Tax=Phreatobacter sp. TaxID=1966341 RepID=UPI001A62777E|nr:DUF1330 domain-containing protein [Phreatobacter sp.]MBL8569848.1 DUF1330 domain-containing protein [Phreatobacter sp.]
MTATSQSVPAYAIAQLRSVQMGPQIVEYLRRIDATLTPFGGRFIVHGGNVTVLEGDWKGDIIVIAFPDRASLVGWYGSPAYQNILRLRTDFSDGVVVIAEGVSEDHKATDVLAGI